MRVLPLACLLAATCLAMPAVAADAWPSKTIKMIVPYPPGGSSDNVARLIAAGLTTALGQTVYIENRGGAGAAIGTQAAATAAADGYTLMMAPSAVMTITPYLRTVPYAVGDFVPIATLASNYGIVAARKDLPANNMAELAALAKKEPGKLTFGSAGVATATHISGELVHQKLGIQVLHVPFKGSSDSLNALMGGQIDLIYDPVALPQIRAGAVKVLAVSGKGRIPELPNVPTLKEQGIDTPGNSWFGVFAPKGTPQVVVDRVAAAIEKMAQSPEIEKRLLAVSLYPDYRDPKAFAKAIAEEGAFYKELFARLGLKVE